MTAEQKSHPPEDGSPFRTVKALVIGDAMLDRYIEGTATRISPEAPVPVVEQQSVTVLPGGAGNVAANLAALGAPTSFLFPAPDSQEPTFREYMRTTRGSAQRPLIDVLDVLTCKTRITVGGSQICRVDRDSRARSSANLDGMYASIFRRDRPDVLVVSDYGKGAVSDTAMQSVAMLTREHKTPTVIDPCPRNRDFTRFSEFHEPVLTPNGMEALQLAGTMNPQEFTDKLSINGAFITLGEHGIAAYRTGERPVMVQQQSQQDVRDVTGAGDVVTAVVALSRALGLTTEYTCMTANRAGAIAVASHGVRTVDWKELSLEILQKPLDTQSVAPYNSPR